MDIIRILRPKKEGKFYNLYKFSNLDKIFILNKDIKKDFIIKFIGKRSKIYTKNINFAEFNTSKNGICYIFFIIIITKSPGFFKRFWHYKLCKRKRIWGTLV